MELEGVKRYSLLELKQCAVARGFTGIADWRRQFRRAQAEHKANRAKEKDPAKKARLTRFITWNNDTAKTYGLFRKAV